MKHTPEPWEVRKDELEGTVWIAPSGDHQCGAAVVRSCGAHSFETDGANAARVVSCVNALAGLNPEGVRACVDVLYDIAHGDWDELGPDEDGRAYREVPSSLVVAARAALEKVKQ